MKTLLILPILAIALFTVAARAQNPEAFFEKAKLAKTEGRFDEAQQLYDQGKKLEAELKERGRNTERAPKSDNIKREVAELHGAGKHDEAERLERRLRERRDDDGSRGPGSFAPDSERMRHVQEAIEHLRMAGWNEPAEHLEQLARRQHREREQRDRPPQGQPPQHQEAMQREMRELQSRFQEMQGQLKKMAGSLDELRGQVKRQDEGAKDRQ